MAYMEKDGVLMCLVADWDQAFTDPHGCGINKLLKGQLLIRPLILFLSLGATAASLAASQNNVAAFLRRIAQKLKVACIILIMEEP